MGKFTGEIKTRRVAELVMVGEGEEILEEDDDDDSKAIDYAAAGPPKNNNTIHRCQVELRKGSIVFRHQDFRFFSNLQVMLPSEACPTLCGLLGGKRPQYGVSNTLIFGIFFAKVAGEVGGGHGREGGGR